MTIVDHHAIDDLPWRPNYSVAHSAGAEQGVTSSLVYSKIAFEHAALRPNGLNTMHQIWFPILGQSLRRRRVWQFVMTKAR